MIETNNWLFFKLTPSAVANEKKTNSADEEAGGGGNDVGADEEKFENQDGQVQVETSQRQSLTHRISSLYETIISKAAPKKSAAGAASSGGIGNAAADVDAKV